MLRRGSFPAGVARSVAETASAIGRSHCNGRGTRSATDLASTVNTPVRSCRRPFAGHVGLAEADQAVAADPAGQRVRLVDHQRRNGRIGRADHRAVGVDQSQRQARRRAAQQPVGDRRRRRARPGPYGTFATAGQRSESIAAE